jgi:hypothetical protein
VSLRAGARHRQERRARRGGQGARPDAEAGEEPRRAENRANCSARRTRAGRRPQQGATMVKSEQGAMGGATLELEQRRPRGVQPWTKQRPSGRGDKAPVAGKKISEREMGSKTARRLENKISGG